MPQLTQLERDVDICWSQWQSPDSRSVSDFWATPMDERQISEWLNGADPPRPFGVPLQWRHKESQLERMFTNGQQDVGPNEMGDVSGYVEGGQRAPEMMKVIIQEPGDKPVEVRITGRERAAPVEATGPANNGKVPSYTIVKGVTTKVSER